MSFQSVRGMPDVLPTATPRWRLVEQACKSALLTFGYDEVRLPLLEPTALFSRGVGEATDIVEKEMYTLTDRDGDSLSLRPEGTAGCVRQGIQHGLLFNQQQRLWYGGPMFRYERPQKGRYRQFEQIGVEVFGISGAAQDAELIQLCEQVFQQLGVRGALQLQINSLGSPASRQAHRQALVDFLSPRQSQLDADSQRRLQRNPLRILDSKDPNTQALLAEAPRLQDFLSTEDRAHFAQLCALLDTLQIGYVVNTQLVRGLDYYTHTVFEWVTDKLGAQGTVCAGGRYDGLVEQLGGKATPGAGFAFGIDRVVLLHEALYPDWTGPALQLYGLVMSEAQQAWALRFCQALRQQVPGLRLRLDLAGGKLKSQLKRADASGAELALIFGEDEAAADAPQVKWLRQTQPQQQLTLAALVALLAAEQVTQ